MPNKIGWVSCYECGSDDVSYSPNSPFPPFCWTCKTWVDIIVRIDHAN